MIFTVEDLLEGRTKPVSITATKSVVDAVSMMTEHDFGQLPVVNEEDRPIGIITSDSIVRASNHFGALLKDLKVSDALEEATTVRFDGDLFELLDDVQRRYAVLIVDAQGHLSGIVTHYDTTAYFRRRAEDMMVIEDIETTLKEYILTIYRDAAGKPSSLQDAINDVTNSARRLRTKYEAALRAYLSNTGRQDSEITAQAVENSFKCFGSREDPKDFDDLTLDEFTAVLLRHKDRPKIGANEDPSAVRQLLQGVRDTRNILAHFRSEITAEQRDRLRFCSKWLSRAFSSLQSRHAEPEAIPAIQAQKRGADSPPTEEAPQATDSIYAPLAATLLAVPPGADETYISFAQIEAIIEQKLPKSAREHRAWWANDPSHTQARQWLAAGWKVKSISGEVVTFSKIKDGEEDYIRFFSALVAALREHTEIKPPDLSPKGLSYFCCAVLRGTNKRQLRIYSSFSRSKGLRVELYIDVGSKLLNKRIFDIIFSQREAIEHSVAGSLSWERLEARSAARIALYHPATANSEPSIALVPWAADAVVRMVNALSDPTRKALDEAGR